MMGKLLKYEGRKTAFAKLVLLVTALLLEAAFLIGFYTKKEELTSIAAMLLTVAAFSGVVLIGVLSVTTLHRDMNTRQSYMLFMTPNSSYRILGAKLIECAVSLLLCGAFFFGLGFLDISLVMGRVGESAWRMLLQIVRGFIGSFRLDLPHIAAFTCWMITSWLCTITTAYLADVISSALLNGKKGNLAATFIFFIVLNVLLGRLERLTPQGMTRMNAFLFRSGVSLALSVVMYFVTARIMDRRLSV